MKLSKLKLSDVVEMKRELSLQLKGHPIIRRVSAEFFGTAFLVCVVVGSGIMGQKLSSDFGVVLLINCMATVTALGILISLLAPISGAHLNPVVSISLALTKKSSLGEVAYYFLAQVAGAVSGAVIANLMFDLNAIQISSRERITTGTFLGEVIATAGLIAIILILLKRNQSHLIAVAVPAWIASAYFFTSSTSFANPAVTVGRVFSDTFAGIAPSSVLLFVVAQTIGAALGIVISKGVSRV